MVINSDSIDYKKLFRICESKIEPNEIRKSLTRSSAALRMTLISASAMRNGQLSSNTKQNTDDDYRNELRKQHSQTGKGENTSIRLSNCADKAKRKQLAEEQLPKVAATKERSLSSSTMLLALRPHSCRHSTNRKMTSVTL